MTRICATVKLRAVHDVEPLSGESDADMRADELANLCRELSAALYANPALGWVVDVIYARETHCGYRSPAAVPCPERATDVVAGDDLCARHAAGARRLLDRVLDGGRA